MAENANVGEADPNRAEVPRHLVLAAYDLLPTRFKELYDDSPVPFNPLEWLPVIRQQGEAVAFEIILRAIRTSYPGWSPVRRKERKKV